MKKTAPSAVLLVIASTLLLSSCDAMFNTNLFKAAGLGQFKLANADLGSPSGVTTAAQSSPDAFYSQLANDPTSKAQALATLTKSGTPANLVLAAAIQIKTTDAGAVVDNVASKLPDLMASGTVNPATVISSILPSSIDTSLASPPPAFVTMISAFVSASSSITTAVNSSKSSGAALPAVPGGTNQDTAYMGVVALSIAAVQPTNSTTSTADALWASIKNPSATPQFTIDSNKFSMSSGSTANTLLQAADINPTSFQ